MTASSLFQEFLSNFRVERDSNGGQFLAVELRVPFSLGPSNSTSNNNRPPNHDRRSVHPSQRGPQRNQRAPSRHPSTRGPSQHPGNRCDNNRGYGGASSQVCRPKTGRREPSQHPTRGKSTHRASAPYNPRTRSKSHYGNNDAPKATTSPSATPSNTWNTSRQPPLDRRWALTPTSPDRL
ncbi:hypothetical protein H257_10213 [Aphanomyces astaci]|uniref:Uncharacterized protein n=1 Tax=Aphanomyces astaci TaxID=112090 RepID=W4G8R5_APHAT|nr:hypothetical protein H257_10213 [Aphanomyces astaci]ETV75353.1 hypothetical protein H257_10213 [Aphanomyces astaci]|eukprot:XP_009834987.1 hypothetical protein H257_10213 [Aphanomyces astaci]